MNLNSKKILRSMMMSFLFIVGMIFFSSITVRAANSTDLYYSSKAVAISYNQEGSVNLGTIDIYAYNNGAGYQLNSVSESGVELGDLRIYSVSVKDGDEEILSASMEDEADFITKVRVYRCNECNAPSNLTKKYVDVIEIIGVKNNENSNFSSNTLSVNIVFEFQNVFLGWGYWTDYKKSVNVYKDSSYESSLQGEANLNFNKSTSEFASSYLTVDSLVVYNYPKGERRGNPVEVFNRANFNNNDVLKMELITNYKFNGIIHVHYNTSNNSTGRISNFNFNGTSSYERVLNSNVFTKSGIDSLKFTFSGFSLNTVHLSYDLFGNQITRVKASENAKYSYILDTKGAQLESYNLSVNNNQTLYDATEVKLSYEFGEKVKYVEVSDLTISVGGAENKFEKFTITNTFGSIEASESKIIFGNGVVKVTEFVLIVTDMYDNKSTILINSAIDETEEIVLESSITNIATDYNYYYSGNDVDIEVELTSIGDLNGVSYFSNVELLFDNDEKFSINKNYWTQTDNILVLKYFVSNEIKTIKGIIFYRDGIEIVYKEFSPLIKLNEFVSFQDVENVKNIGNDYNFIVNKVRTTGNSKISTFNYNLLEHSNNEITISECSIVEEEKVECTYTSTNDSKGIIKVKQGAITFEDGAMNAAYEFEAIFNNYYPVETILLDASYYVMDESNKLIYYRNNDKVIKMELNDGWFNESGMSLLYTFDYVDDGDDSEFVVANIENGKYVIHLPTNMEEVTLTYITNDGDNQSVKKSYENKFVYKNSINDSGISILLNGDNISQFYENESQTFVSDKYYNNLIFTYDDITPINSMFIKEFSISVDNGSILKSIPSTGEISVSKQEFGSKEQINVPVIIEIVDKLGNKLLYNLYLNIDTLDPDFSSLLLTNSKIDEYDYEVTVSGYGEYSISVKIDGIDTPLNNDKFITNKDFYSITLTDAAGNYKTQEYATETPTIEMFHISGTKYEINITPFKNKIHTLDEFIYLVFDYAVGDISQQDIEAARANVCTTGRKVGCYKNGDLASASEGVITQTFANNYTYIIQVKVNNVYVNDGVTGKLPRLDLDNGGPIGGYLNEDINPDFISSLSQDQFDFWFKAKDLNLSNSFKYLIVSDSKVNNIKNNPTNFKDLYNQCNGALSNVNGCAIFGSITYESEKEDDWNIGKVTITSNSTVEKRFINGIDYVLFVLLEDASNNSTVFQVRKFKNITSSATIEYFNDLGSYEKINDGYEVTTVNSTKIRIKPYLGVDLRSIKINGNEFSCDKSLGCEIDDLNIGENVVEVQDELGNSVSVTIYSAATDKPIIYVYYKYNDKYFRILDDSYYYNTSNASNVYIKVLGESIKKVTISSDSTIDYVKGNELYDSITNKDSQYGIKLSEIMNIQNANSYSGNIIVGAANDKNRTVSITLVVDNVKPIITLTPPGSQVNLFGELVTIGEKEDKYELTYHYKKEVTYLSLMEALSVKVDEIDFADMIDVDRLSFEANSQKVDYLTTIDGRNKEISINYFDAAGNVADTVYIKLVIIPVISLKNQIEKAELNTNVKLSTVLVNGKEELDNDMILNVKINLNDINYEDYLFNQLGTYEVIYTISDTSSNILSSFVQTILVEDTTAPSLKENTISEYQVGLNQDLLITLPEFIDNDGETYSAFEIKMFDINDEEMNPYLINYPIKDNNSNSIKVNFNSGYTIGTYKIVFVVKDNANNAMEQIFMIRLQDADVPTITIKINGKIIENGAVNTYALNSSLTIEVSAYDGYDGALNQISRKIMFNGKEVSRIDTTKFGDYIVEYSAKDSNGNISKSIVTIRINEDKQSPVINKVIVNDKELLQSGNTKFNAQELTIVVDATDDCTDVSVVIKINGKSTMKNGDVLVLESGLEGEYISIQIVVKDTSGNETTRTYKIVVDNKAPLVVGAKENDISSQKVNLSVSDNNISKIEIYRNEVLLSSSNSDIENLELSENGMYRVVALDYYGNITNYVFGIELVKAFNIMVGNEPDVYNYDYASLVEVLVENDNLIFKLEDNKNINSGDSIYILVNYPNSQYKYVLYTMNGDTYISNDNISIEGVVMDGVENTELLEKLGDKYYAYVMVVKNANEGNGETNELPKETNHVLKYILVTLMIILGISLGLFLIVKLRRRVRAI